MIILKFLISLPLLFLIGIYKFVISPLTMPSCRHSPSCSSYATEMIYEWGPLKGGWLSLLRILRCHPWGTYGYDPIKKNPDKHITN